MPSDVYKASRLIKMPREGTESQGVPRASCDNMFLTRFATCPRCPPRSRFGPRTRNYIPDDVISFIATRANGGKGKSWGHEREEDTRREGPKVRRVGAEWVRVADDKGEGDRKREWNTTSTIATRKFDFQIGVAQANGPREEGRRILRIRSLCITSVSVY